MSACRLLRTIWFGPCCCRHVSQHGPIFLSYLPIFFFPRKKLSLPSYSLSSSSPRMIADSTSLSPDTAQIRCRGTGPRSAALADVIASGISRFVSYCHPCLPCLLCYRPRPSTGSVIQPALPTPLASLPAVYSNKERIKENSVKVDISLRS
jgi:hypothetical protein